ncbi:MAG: AMP-binding protein [Acidimicrobiia bacterium]
MTALASAEVASLMAEVLKLKDFAVEDDFLTSGGDSLRVVQLAVRIAERLGDPIDARGFAALVTGIFDRRTAASIAPLTGELTAAPVAAAPQPSEPATLSAQQHQIWIHRRANPDSAAYNVVNVFDLVGPVDSGSLETALRSVAGRHPALLTALDTHAGLPATSRHDPEGISVVVAPRASGEAAAFATVDTIAATPFSFGELPIRCHLVPYGSGEAHLLMFVIDHASCDGWSMPIFYRELSVLYGGARLPDPPPTPAAVRHAGDAAEWADRLRPIPPPLDLDPTVSRGVRDFAGAVHYTMLAPDLVDQLRAWLAARSATLFMGLMTCFQLALSDLTGRSRFLLGVPVANRGGQHSERAVAYLANTMVLQAVVEDSSNYAGLLGTVRANVIDGLVHQSAPFMDLVEELRPPRDPTRTPLIDVLFVMQNSAPVALELAGCSVTQRRFDNGTAKFDLTLEAHETGGGVGLRWERAAALSPAIVDSVIARFERHATAMAADLPRLRPPKQPPRPGPPQDRSIGAAFARVASERADQAALVTDNGTTTFAELHLQAAAVAEKLLQQGLGPGSRIGVLHERTPEWVAAAIGTWLAGGIYVPLDPALPDGALKRMISAGGVAHVVASAAAAERAAGLGPPVSLTGEIQALPPGSKLMPPLEAGPAGPAYVVFTSGSTGAARGVIGHHAGLLNRIAWMHNGWPVAEGELGCLRTGIGFIDSLTELLGPMLAGRPSLVVPDSAGRAATELLELLRRHKVSRLVITPSYLRLLLVEFPERFAALTGLSICVVSGERLTADVCIRFYRLQPGAVLLNLYGTSEVAGDVTWYDTRALAPLADPVPIGRPLPGCTVSIEDEQGQPVPGGSEGELVVSGVQVALGYTGAPSPGRASFAERAGVRRFRTGDLGRQRPDGAIEYVGRIDRVVKVRGIAVDPDGVEAMLQELPGVTGAAVIPCHGSDGSWLHAWIEPEADVDAIRAGLLRDAPAHMVPAVISAVPVLPRTPSGKLDYVRLGGPAHQAPAAPAAKLGPLEEAARDVICEVLGVATVGITDNFFSSGGDSLRANRVLARISDRFKLGDLDFASFYREPTVTGLATLVAAELMRGTDPEVSAVVRARLRARGSP